MNVILDHNNIGSQGLQSISTALQIRATRLNQIDYKSRFPSSDETIIMPLLTLSVEGCEINDFGIKQFVDKMEDIKVKHEGPIK